MGRTTRKDVARAAGVSESLISMYLTGNNAARMSEATRERINAAIRQLNYSPDRTARSLRSGRTRCIGMLVGGITNPYFAHLVEEALAEAALHDYQFLLALTRWRKEEEEKALRYLLSHRPDAVLYATYLDEESPGYTALREAEIPFLCMNRHMQTGLCLNNDYRTPMLEACREFQRRGHRRIAGYFRNNPVHQSEFVAACRDAGAEFELLPEEIQYSTNEISPYMTDLEEKFAPLIAVFERSRPEALICNGQELLCTLLTHAAQIGDNCRPEIVAVADEFSQKIESPLLIGIIKENTTAMAREGIRQLIRRIEEPQLPRNMILPPLPAQFELLSEEKVDCPT